MKVIIKLDEGYFIFRTIRNSPLTLNVKEVMAMMRRLGISPLLVSVSVVDIY